MENLQNELIYTWCQTHVLALNYEWVKNPLTWQVSARDLFRAYCWWVRKSGRVPCSELWFCGAMRGLFPDSWRPEMSEVSETDLGDEGLFYGLRLIEGGFTESDPDIRDLYRCVANGL